MTPQGVADFISQQWVLHGDDVQAWIAVHRWTLLLVAAVLTLLWVRDQKRRGKI
jgi:hypothetical protein